MTLFLSVLKIIGIVLLILLGIVLSILLIILFVPFRYRIEGKIKAGDNYYDFRTDVTWLLHILHGIFTFLKSVMEDECSDEAVLEKQGFHYEIRLFGIRIRPKKEKEEALEYPEPEGSSELLYREEEADRAEERKEPYRENEGEKREEPAKEEPAIEDHLFDDDIPEGFSAKVKDFTGMLRRLPKKLKSVKENAGYKYRDFCDKIDELRSRIKHYYELINDESTGNALKLAWDELMRILRALKPRKYSVDLIYGFEDPALTGELTGVFSALFLSAGKRVRLRPDFENSVMEGELLFKGRIRIITLVIVLWRLYFSKDFRKFYKEIRG